MSDEHKIAKAGKLLCVDSGEYSDKSVHGFFVVLQDFEPDAELAMHLEAHPEQLEPYHFEEDSYLASLLAKGFLMEVSYGTIHLCGYSNHNEFNFTPSA